jgi:hypothetical protein
MFKKNDVHLTRLGSLAIEETFYVGKHGHDRVLF